MYPITQSVLTAARKGTREDLEKAWDTFYHYKGYQADPMHMGEIFARTHYVFADAHRHPDIMWHNFQRYLDEIGKNKRYLSYLLLPQSLPRRLKLIAMLHAAGQDVTVVIKYSFRGVEKRFVDHLTVTSAHEKMALARHEPNPETLISRSSRKTFYGFEWHDFWGQKTLLNLLHVFE